MSCQEVNAYESNLRHILHIPQAAQEASGIVVFGRKIKTLIFSTDIAIIRNCDADAVFAVYPFTPQSAVSDSLIRASYIPVFCGVGGGTTQGLRTISLAKDAEAQGAVGVVLNAPVSDLNVLGVARAVDLPVIVTVTKFNTNITARLKAGASILNIAAAEKTPELVADIRRQFPAVPIIASGGGTDESILRTINAGANAITYTPPSTKQLFTEMMEKYREY